MVDSQAPCGVGVVEITNMDGYLGLRRSVPVLFIDRTRGFSEGCGEACRTSLREPSGIGMRSLNTKGNGVQQTCRSELCSEF